jgi:hypothetical protein
MSSLFSAFYFFRLFIRSCMLRGILFASLSTSSPNALMSFVMAEYLQDTSEKLPFRQSIFALPDKRVALCKTGKRSDVA